MFNKVVKLFLEQITVIRTASSTTFALGELKKKHFELELLIFNNKCNS